MSVSETSDKNDNITITNKVKIMKTKNSLLRINLSSGFAFALALAVWLPATAHAQDTTKPMKPMKSGEHQMMANPSNSPAEGKGMMPMEGKMMKSCKAMMEKKQKMMMKMKAQDAALSKQAAKMNRAPSDKKTGLMADVVTQLVEQRMARDEQKAKMQEKMMQHMMQHMQMGKESMAQCPMMKGMKGMDDMKGMNKR
jgi:hypothetical protein